MEQPRPHEGQSDVSVLHQALVDKLKADGHIHSTGVEAAFRAVPRHVFVPGMALETVYSDVHIVTKEREGHGLSSSSQPAIMAIMLEQLELHPGQRVLEIGAGTGYNAALMAHLVGDTGHVVTIDIDDDIVADARDHLRAAGFEQVHVVRGDGGRGYPAAAPYDRIVLTVGAADIAPAWWQQLAAGGRLVLPLELTPLALKNNVHALLTFDRADGYLESAAIHACGFLPLRGSFASGREGLVSLGAEPGLTLVTAIPVDADAIYAVLTGPHRDSSTGIRVMPREVGGICLWLAMREPRFCYLYAEGDLTKRGIVPFLAGDPSTFISACGQCEPVTLCLLMSAPDAVPASSQPAYAEKPFDLMVRSFDSDAMLAQQLTEHVAVWDAAGRPFVWSQQWEMEGLRIRAYPQGTEYTPAANEAVIDKRSVRLVCAWQAETSFALDR